ncbi:hypothetical protein [Pararhodobacter sp. SW119]|uniref:hypothetical protein n=1 Tax=Pararhodobacter sp. SW119 TaxID=2780075 RepID=UPI001AE07A0A|nr:hypothetical protein [Pararhodobacter sp. SW119]
MPIAQGEIPMPPLPEDGVGQFTSIVQAGIESCEQSAGWTMDVARALDYALATGEAGLIEQALRQLGLPDEALPDAARHVLTTATGFLEEQQQDGVHVVSAFASANDPLNTQINGFPPGGGISPPAPIVNPLEHIVQDAACKFTVCQSTPTGVTDPGNITTPENVITPGN